MASGLPAPPGLGQSGSSKSVAIVFAQVRFVCSSLTEDNLPKYRESIADLIAKHGADTHYYYLRQLMLYVFDPAGVTGFSGSNAAHLKLLQSEIKRLSSDPASVSKIVAAIAQGLNDSSAACDFLRNHFDVRSFFEKVKLSPVEKAILAAEFIQLIFPAYEPRPTINTAISKRKDYGLAAVMVFRENWAAFLKAFGNQSADSKHEVGPMEASQLTSRFLSDWSVNFQKGEGGYTPAQPGWDRVLKEEDARLWIKTMAANYGDEAAMQIAAYAANDIQLAPNTSPVKLLERLLPAAEMSNIELVRICFERDAYLAASTANGAAEQKVVDIMNDLISIAPRHEDRLPINISHIITAANDLKPELRWCDAVRVFDTPSRPLPADSRSLRALAEFLAASAEVSSQTTFTETSAISGLWALWANPALQITLISRLISAHSDIMAKAVSLIGEKVVPASSFASSSELVQKLASAVQGSVWNSFDLFSTLSRISETPSAEIEEVQRRLLELAIGEHPQLVAIAVARLQPQNDLFADILRRVIPPFLAGHNGYQLVLLRIWQTEQPFLMNAFRDMYSESETNINRIVDIAIEINILADMLEVRPYHFALDIAATASKREVLDLGKWLDSCIQNNGSIFVRAALEFIGHKVRHDLGRQNQGVQQEQASTTSLSVQTIANFMRALRLHHELFGPEEIELFKEVRTQCLQLHPRLMNFAPGADQEPGISVVSFTPEVEQEVDGFYTRMYDQDISVENVVEMLQKAKDSEKPKDHEFLACFLHTLFEEYKFFATYPPKELGLTAALFGSLIQCHLIDYIPLGIAVRYVLDALRNPPDTNWFKFGVQALTQFQSRLHEWPQLSQAILGIPHLPQVHPEIAETARTALIQASEEHNPDVQVNGEAEVDKPFTAINVEREPGQPEQPPEAVSDKILFIINNLAPANLEDKLHEMDGQLDVAYHRWFANYLVAQRVSIEPNNHTLYMQFLDALKLPPLMKYVLRETLIKVDGLINSEQTVQSSTERTLLKNLGAWLGNLTLAKNKAIKHQNIAFKDLLIQGYDSNRLIVAIPFVCKVLEQCAKSKIFKPPNPWLMGILRLLVELYQFAELKLNLKFEIEVLCKSLDIDLKQLTPTSTLRDRPPRDAITADAGSSVVQDLERASLGGFASAGQAPSESGRSTQASLLLPSQQPGYSLALADAVSSALQNLPTYITFNPHLPIFTNANMKRLVHLALDRAIREIIAPVVERSVTIAGISTKELTTKDFAMEGNEEKMRQAAHLMVRNLAGSLALVTCKEPLRTSIITHIRNLLLQNGFSEGNLPTEAIQIVVSENLELACSIVEKVAMDKAVSEVDDALTPSFMSRLKHRERSNQAFWDTAAMAASHYSGMLPDPLRLKLGGLQPPQLRVYEDFAKRQTFTRPDSPSHAGESTPAPITRDLTPAPPSETGPVGGLLTSAQVHDTFMQYMTEIDKHLQSSHVESLQQIPADSEVRLLIRQIPVTVARSANKDESVLACSQKVVQMLYRTELPIARELYVVLLAKLCDISPKVAKEVKAWLIYAEDERKFNVSVTIALIMSGLVNIADLDAQLAKFIVADFRPTVLDFVAELVKECVLGQNPIVSRQQIAACLDALTQAHRAGKGTPAVNALFDDQPVTPTPALTPAAANGEITDESSDAVIRERLQLFFIEWVRIYQNSYALEKSFVDFVVQLQNQGILKGEEISSMFFRVCTEVSVDTYIKQKAVGGSMATGIFQPVDAFAKLIVFMIKYHADPHNKNHDQAKVHYMTKVLSIVVLVLAQSHEEMEIHFQQKPFYRFFSSLLSNLSAIENHLGPAYNQIIIALSHSVNTLQPLFFPGFTFSWIALISHRLFMPKLLHMKEREGWAAFHRLLLSLLRFQAPFLEKGKLNDITRDLYTGTLRIALVLLHDFPEFLCIYHASLIDVIPTCCIQLKNIILSAYPMHIQLVDPIRAILNNDPIPEMSVAPTIVSDYTAALQPAEFRTVLDKYVQTKQPANFLSTGGLMERIYAQKAVNGEIKDEGEEKEVKKYNISFINSLTLYLGAVSVYKGLTRDQYHDAVTVGIFRHILKEVDVEGVYTILNAMANQLRYPNSHTAFFSSLFLFLFENVEEVRETITRVLLERLLVSRPHPFGLLYVFTALIRTPKFFEDKFTRATPEVEALLRKVQFGVMPHAGELHA